MAAGLLSHLWQSTLVAMAAWALTVVLRQYSARTRYLIWFAASVKFLIPFSALVALGLQLRSASSIGSGILPEPLLSATLRVAESASMTGPVNTVFAADPGHATLFIWALGCLIVLTRWCICWLRARALVHAATPYPMDINIEVRVSTEVPEPGVFGIREPVLLLPSAVVSRLSPAELDAIIEHELRHVRNRDNLTAAVHMLVEAVFWYHPLVWWIGRRMLKERERACDEAVIELGVTPRVYAEGILKACRLSLESRLGAVAAAAGSNLQERVVAIMSWRPARRLSNSGKASLVTIALTSFVLPLLTGFAMPSVNGTSLAANRAGSQHFDSVTITETPLDSRDRPRLTLTPTQLSMRNMSLRKLISVACGLRERQVLGGPVWLDWHYDIEANTKLTIDRRMILGLLTDRFELQFIDHNPRQIQKDSL